MGVTGTEIELAYRKLKSYVYYEKNNLALRERLAMLECSAKFEGKLLAVQKVSDGKEPANDGRFKKSGQGLWAAEGVARV
ncbi:MAG: hypothetical protein K0S57_98 [Ramlibacter sp.]|jgi:hypothetical protein|nr:hypothetical protein [Ramlibacter sp.]